MVGHIAVTPASGSSVAANTTTGLGYGNLTNFTITLSGSDIVAFSAVGVVILVALMLVFTRTGRKEHN
jgi:hypothetical protein